jgi:hypothetical protein
MKTTIRSMFVSNMTLVHGIKSDTLNSLTIKKITLL